MRTLGRAASGPNRAIRPSSQAGSSRLEEDGEPAFPEAESTSPTTPAEPARPSVCASAPAAADVTSGAIPIVETTATVGGAASSAAARASGVHAVIA
jgi:hypothetical protein